MVDKKEIKHRRIDQMDRAEVESRLQQLIEKNQLAPALEQRAQSAQRAGVVIEGELGDELEGELADEEIADEELADEDLDVGEDEESLDLEDELEDEGFQEGLDQES